MILNVKTLCATLVFGIVTASSCFAQEGPAAMSGTMMPQMLNSLGNVQLGQSIGDAATSGDLGQALGALTADLVPRLLTSGGIQQQLLGAVAGEGIVFLVETAVGYAKNTPDTRPRIEQLMARVGMTYDDVFVPFVPERGRLGQLEYQIALREGVIQALTVQAVSRGESFIPDATLLGELSLLQTQLVDEISRTQPPVPEDTPIAGAGSCITSETELFQLFKNASGGGIMYANNAVIRVLTNSRTEPISGDLENFHLYDIALCTDLMQAKNAAPLAVVSSGETHAVSNTGIYVEDSYLLQQILDTAKGIVRGECGGDGDVAPNAVFLADLTMDGTVDFIIDATGISCVSGRRAASCGAQVCTSYVFLFEDEYYVQNLEMLNTVRQIIPGSPPSIEIVSHGGQVGRIVWGGHSFVRQ